MTEIIKPGAGVLFMKVGTHARETLEDIIARKAKEIKDAGYALWGYGGSTCHPQSMVQPFAKHYSQKGGSIYLCMEPMQSKHFALPVRGDLSSIDGINWSEVHPAINVRGSRYALVIEDLEPQDFKLDLAKTRVAIGNSEGRSGDAYVKGRVDKACLEVTSAPVGKESKLISIGLVARLREPYALYIRNSESD